MTRGTLILITNEQVYNSIELNGDMYPEGLGDKTFNLLSDVTDLKTFKDVVLLINNNYSHEGRLIHKKVWFVETLTHFGAGGDMYDEMEGMFESDNSIDFNNNYYSFGRFFSDWIFIKNISDKDINFKDREEEEYILSAGQTIRLNFGTLYKEKEGMLDEN